MSSQPESANVVPGGDDLVTRLAAEVQSRGLRPGDRLPPEVDLARTLGVGRAKLRETLVAWQRMGLLHRNKGAGTVLTASVSRRMISMAVAVEAETLSQMLAVRRPLELEATRLAATAAGPGDRSRIAARLEDLLSAHASGQDWRAADHAFHGAIHDATGNPLFGQVIGQLQRAVQAVYAAPFGQPHVGSSTIPLHAPLGRAVIAGDAGEAVRLMADILDRTEAEARGIAATLGGGA